LNGTTPIAAPNLLLCAKLVPLDRSRHGLHLTTNIQLEIPLASFALLEPSSPIMARNFAMLVNPERFQVMARSGAIGARLGLTRVAMTSPDVWTALPDSMPQISEAPRAMNVKLVPMLLKILMARVSGVRVVV